MQTKWALFWWEDIPIYWGWPDGLPRRRPMMTFVDRQPLWFWAV